MERYTSIKQITIKVDLYSAVIFKSYILHLVFASVQLELVVHAFYFTWPAQLDTVSLDTGYYLSI